mmetsp:Transcript_10353/g.15465  ORF Transcript_10353/g.15465 Transcript_10353/m.15465 type:complete len:193 (+) Transcript_10353:386-964(+)
MDSNIMPTSGPRQIDSVTLFKIKQKSQEREYEVVDDPIGRIKLKNYTSEDSALSNEAGLFCYYCTLCGKLCLVTTEPIGELPRRRTDSAVIIPNSHSIQFVKYLNKGTYKKIKRDSGYEKQWTWACSKCGIQIAYQSCSYDVIFPNEITFGTPKKNLGSYHFYILKNSLTGDISSNELLEEIAKLRKKVKLN